MLLTHLIGVWHDGLIQKRRAYGFRGDMDEWLKSFQSSIKQHVDFSNSHSFCLPVKVSVCKGSVLGPLSGILALY